MKDPGKTAADDRGDVDIALILIVFTFVGVLLLLFGVSFN